MESVDNPVIWVTDRRYWHLSTYNDSLGIKYDINDKPYKPERGFANSIQLKRKMKIKCI